MKKGIVTSFAERARVICDDDKLEDELQNIEDVFVANEYRRDEVRTWINEPRKVREEEKEPPTAGRITLPYVKGLAERFKKIASAHNFKVSYTPGTKLKQIRRRCETQNKEKKTGIVYKIPCGCGEAVYVGESKRRYETRLAEHERKVRLTGEDIDNGDLESAKKRMGSEDGGLAKHNNKCDYEINWEQADIIGEEQGGRQRKVREGIESIKADQ